MRLKIISVAFASAIAVSSVGAAFAAPDPKIYICHATGSDSNPFVLIHVSANAIDAHRAHDGDRPANPIEIKRGDCTSRGT